MTWKRANKHHINFYLEKEDYEILANTALRCDITFTELVRRYSQYLKTKDYRHRRALDENSKEEFNPGNNN